MENSIFNNLLLSDIQFNINHEIKGLEYPFESLSKFLNYILPSEYIVIGGRPMSGREDFIDYVYVINLYFNWLLQEEENRNPLKIFYFGMNEQKLKNKLKKWLCTYIYINHKIYINTVTLNPNSKGKLFDLRSKEESIQEVNKFIENADEYFDNFLDEVLEFIPGEKSPSKIEHIIKTYMKSIGTLKRNGEYYIDKEYSKQLTLVIVDDISKLETEVHDLTLMNESSLLKNFDEIARHLKNTFGVSIVVGVPSKTSYTRTAKDSEPNYKELGVFIENADKAIILYNPDNENQKYYRGIDVEEYMIKDYNKLRTVFIAKNNTGCSNVEKPMIYLQGPGIFKEISLDKEEAARQRSVLLATCSE